MYKRYPEKGKNTQQEQSSNSHACTVGVCVCVCVCVCCRDDFDMRENQERVCPSRENAHAQSTPSKLLTNLSYWLIYATDYSQERVCIVERECTRTRPLCQERQKHRLRQRRLMLLYMCPHTAVSALILLYMCPHTAIYCYICVLILCDEGERASSATNTSLYC